LPNQLVQTPSQSHRGDIRTTSIRRTFINR
jgi:hypothetical protein